jgi:molecular chaperone GrpE
MSQDNEALVARFRHFLDTRPEPEDSDSVDLFSLLTELAGLRNEVRLESRQFKVALDELRRQDQSAVAHESRLGQDLAALWDRLAAGVAALENYQPGWKAPLIKREQQLFASIAEGQRMTLQRLERLMEDQGIKTIVTLGEQLDPHLMRAVATDHQPNLADGIVVAELRRGFLQNGELLRPAEVRVNRIEA